MPRDALTLVRDSESKSAGCNCRPYLMTQNGSPDSAKICRLTLFTFRAARTL